jgi:hypothetical protein
VPQLGFKASHGNIQEPVITRSKQYHHHHQVKALMWSIMMSYSVSVDELLGGILCYGTKTRKTGARFSSYL